MLLTARQPARWLATVAAQLTLLSGVGYVAAAYTLSRLLTSPRRKVLKTTPASLGLEFRDIQIETADAVPLSGWLIEPPQPRGTVALFHGMRQNREQMLSRVQFLAAAGYRCIAIDHRAHGRSGGKRISCGWYESKDVNAVAQWIETNHSEQPRHALGISMGAAAICFAGPECRWTSVILEGAYADLATAISRRIGQNYPPWFRQLAPGALWITEKRLKLRIGDIRPVDAVRHLDSIRILTVTGDRDSLAPPDDSLAISVAAGDTAECIVITGAGHGDACEKGSSTYRTAILRFLDESRDQNENLAT